MIKLKKLVLENNKIELNDNDIEFILSYLENCYQYKHIIFRGSNRITDEYGIKKIREDRYLRNTTNSMNAIVEAYKKFTNQQNVVPDRRNCLFSSTGIEDARYYGSSVYAIFPTNDCTIKYNPVISDSFTEIYKFNNPNGAGIYRDSLSFKKILLSFFNKLNYTELPKLLYAADNSLDVYSIANSINYTTLLKELLTIGPDITKKLYNSKTKYRDMWSSTRSIFERYDEGFIRYQKYLDRITTLELNGKFPDPRVPVELIISGSEYLYVELFTFMRTFEWSNTKKKWQKIKIK